MRQVPYAVAALWGALLLASGTSCGDADPNGTGPALRPPGGTRPDASSVQDEDGGPTSTTDANTPPDPANPARCRVEDPFTGITKLTTLNSDTLDAVPRLTQDERTIVFVSANTGVTSWDLFTATRNDVAIPFPGPVRLAMPNSDKLDSEPAISPDGTRLYFASNRAGENDFRIFLSVKMDNVLQSATEVSVAHVPGKKDTGVSLSPSGDALFFNSDRTATDLLYRVALDGNGVPMGAPVLYDDIDMNGSNSRPSFSPDLLTVYFASERPGTKGLSDIWVATRRTPLEHFGKPTNVIELNNEFGQSMGWISADLCRVYWASSTDVTPLGGLATSDMFVASRPKPR